MIGGREGVIGVEIAGDNKIFYPANVTIDTFDEITFTNLNVKAPVYVYYGAGSCKKVSIYNSEGVPVSPFVMFIK